MKLTAKDIIWAFILGMVCFYFLTKKDTPPQDKITVTEEEKEVFTPEKKDKVKEVVEKPVYIDTTDVEKLRKQISDKYLDSISKLNALVQKQLRINELSKYRNYSKTYENDDYKLTINNKVQGYLLDRNFNLTIKPQKATYIETTTTIEKVPKFSLWFGGGLQSNLNKTYLPIEISAQTRNGDLWDFNYSIDPVDIKQSLFGLTYKKRLFTKY